MEQSHKTDTPTLLPYLQGLGHTVAISLEQDTTETPRHTPNYSSPFVRDTTADPLSRLTFAKLCSDAGTVIKDVILLSQHDQYRVGEQCLWPLNNVDIENAWQELFSSGSRREQIKLSCQTGHDDRLNKLSSLFYCNLSHQYFIPPCPSCGAPLTLCCNDELLKLSGLPPYSTTLRRYLYCPVCCQDNSGPFYTYETSDTDPVFVKDRWGLVKEYKKTVEDGAGNSLLPCVKCSCRADCYGSESDYIFRIIPVFFFPTYLVIVTKPTLKLTDFLPLLSGQPHMQWLQSRMGDKNTFSPTLLQSSPDPENHFYVRHKPEFFLEVLYLKLSLLADLVSKLLTDVGNSRYFRDVMSIERIWVDLAELGCLLPSFWTFNLSFIDDLVPKHNSPFSHRNVSNETAVNLGLLWFEVLLVNSRYDKRAVISTLEALFSHTGEMNDIGQLIESTPILCPDNIFWEQQPEGVPSGGFSFWERTLMLGLSLIQKPDQFQTSAAYAELYNEIHVLSAEVKTALFSGAEKAADAPKTSQGDLHTEEILRVIEMMQAELKATLEPVSESCETVVVSSGEPVLSSTARSQAPVQAEPKANPEPVDETCETVILAGGPVLSSTTSPPARVQAELKAEPEPVDEMCETVVLAGGQSLWNSSGTPPDTSDGTRSNAIEGNRKPSDDEMLTETIVLSGRTGGSADRSVEQPLVSHASGVDLSTEEDQLDATIILPAKSKIPPRRG